MADYDIMTTADRINLLKNVKGEIDLAIRVANEAQNTYNSMMANRNYVQFARVWEYTQEKLNLARTHASQAKAQLDNLLGTYTGVDTNTYYSKFVFAAEWRVGRGGIGEIDFATGAGDDITFFNVGGSLIGDANSNGGAPTSHATLVTNEDDLIIVSGTDSNDGVYTVDQANSSVSLIAVDETLTNESCVNGGASVLLIRRTI